MNNKVKPFPSLTIQVDTDYSSKVQNSGYGYQAKLVDVNALVNAFGKEGFPAKVNEVANKIFQSLSDSDFKESAITDFYNNSREMRTLINEKSDSTVQSSTINHDIRAKVSQLFSKSVHGDENKESTIKAFEACPPEDLGKVLDLETITKINEIAHPVITGLTDLAKRLKVAYVAKALAETFPSTKMNGNYAVLGGVVASNIAAASPENRPAVAQKWATTLTIGLVVNLFRNITGYYKV
jgi:hypothetical protein